MLLTLDLATRVGWTYGAPGDTRFAYGTHILPSTGEDVGSFLWAFEAWFSEATRDVAGSDLLVVFESPIMPKETSLATARKLYGLAGMAQYLCKRQNHACLEVPAASCRRMLGVRTYRSPHLPKYTVKQAVIDAVRRWGYEPGDDDQADAIALRLFVIHEHFPKLRDKFNLRLGALGAA
jgi:hypothetical protein